MREKVGRVYVGFNGPQQGLTHGESSIGRTWSGFQKAVEIHAGDFVALHGPPIRSTFFGIVQF